ncbi:hypothetical protein F0562_014182 [Nyssa sinensis]|uniref:Uncharacterized protein n=1 Tax=Nyssa sinensis TaxID=561372 RepID=A0A5J4ZQC0_9ASTE|nr:hypothetical protein F0562_014182 [Nyssa sinensis]
MLAQRKERDKRGTGPALLKPNTGRPSAQGKTHMIQTQSFTGQSRDRHMPAQRKGKAKGVSGPAHLEPRSTVFSWKTSVHSAAPLAHPQSSNQSPSCMVLSGTSAPDDTPTALPQNSNQNPSSKALPGNSSITTSSLLVLEAATGQRAQLIEGAAVSDSDAYWKLKTGKEREMRRGTCERDIDTPSDGTENSGTAERDSRTVRQ